MVDLTDDRHNFIEVINNGCSPLEFEKYCRRASLPHFVDSKSTILIIDEIQSSSKVYNAIRKLHDSIKCDIIIPIIFCIMLLKGQKNMDEFKKEAASYSTNYYEYLVSSKDNAGTVMRKVLIILAAAVILLVGGYFTLRYLPSLGVILFFLMVIRCCSILISIHRLLIT